MYFHGATDVREQAMNILIRSVGLVLATSALLLLGGCVTPGGYGGGYNGGYEQPAPGYPSEYGSQLQGTVERVDPRYGQISLLVQDTRSGRMQRMDVRYDRSTRLVYQGREYPVDGLERGDVIRLDVASSGREMFARSIQVVSNVRDGRYGSGPVYGNDLRGSVAFVDARARLIRLDGAGYGIDVQLAYDARTVVEYQGRSYLPENLQRGDIVRIQARQTGRNQWLAERIIVERSVGR